ncbi:MAG: LUD domain-containing protein [Bacteroidales bacterium]
MQGSTAKEKVLKNIRSALVNRMEPPFSNVEMDAGVYNEMQDEDSLEIEFAVAFKAVQGQFIYCENNDELKANILSLIDQKGFRNIYSSLSNVRSFISHNKNYNLVDDVSQMPYCDAVITDCECLIARFGSVMLSSRQSLSRKGIAGAEVHIIIAKPEQIVKDIKDAFNYLENKYDGSLPSMFSLVTGPSRTADIEKTLIMGAHGPKELYLFLVS